MSFLSSNLIEEISPNTGPLSENTENLLQHEKSWKDNDLGINHFIQTITQQTDIIDKCAYALQRVNYNQKLK